MSDSSQGEGWWIASDGKWYAPELHPDYVAPAEEAPADDAPDEAEDRASRTVVFPAVAPPTSPPTNPGTAASTVPGEAASAATQPDPFAPTAPPPAGRRRTVLLGLGAVVLVVGVVFLLWRLLGGSSGGADSPEAAVEQLLTSIAEGDEVGIAEIFDPDEIEGWIGSFVPASEVADETGDDQTAAARQFDDFAESLFDAIDVQVSGPDGGDYEFTVEQLDRDGRITRVRVEGLDVRLEVTAEPDETLIVGPPDDLIGLDLSRLDGAGLELRDELGGLSVRAFAPGEEDAEEFAEDVHLDVVTVEKDGGWYLSIGYTVLENVRNAPDVDLGRPDYGRAFRLVEDRSGGAESAEDAVREFVFAFESLDYGRMIELSDPLSLPYLHDFQPAIDREVDPRDVREAARDLDLRVTTLDLSTSDWNDRTLVTVEQLAGRVADGTFDIDTRTWCADAISADGERVDGCLEDAIAEVLEEADQFDVDPRDLVPDAAGMVVVERNGRWFVDPLGTIGYYTEQVADAIAELDLDEALSDSTGVDGVASFIADAGPVVRDGQSVQVTPSDGLAAVAFDLTGLGEPAIDAFDPVSVGLARLTSAGSSRFLGIEDRRADAEEWVVVHVQGEPGGGDPVFPAIALETEDALTVALESIEIVAVGEEGFSGAIADDGRPQIFVFDDLDGDFEFAGTASYETASRWDDYGIIIREGVFSSTIGDPTFGPFTVVSGEPGDPFTFDYFELDTPPEPPPEPEPESPFGDPRVDRFSELVTASGYETFAFEQQGGYFDGCGPADPDVTTFAFESEDLELVLITPYPSEDRAAAAFQALTEIASPCDDFPGLIIESVEVEPGIDAITVTLSNEEDPTLFFEYYARRGDVILVSTGATFERLLDGWQAIADFN